MTKNEFTKRVADRCNTQYRYGYYTPHMMEDVMIAMIEVLIDALVSDGKVTIRDVCSLEVVDYGNKKRGAWNPFKHEPMEYKPKRKIRCRFGKKIRDAIN